MPVSFPDSLEHNNSALPIIKEDNVQGAEHIVADQSAMLAIPVDKLKLYSRASYQDGGTTIIWEVIDLGNTANIAGWRELKLGSDDSFQKEFGSRYPTSILVAWQGQRKLDILFDPDKVSGLVISVRKDTTSTFEVADDLADFRSWAEGLQALNGGTGLSIPTASDWCQAIILPARKASYTTDDFNLILKGFSA